MALGTLATIGLGLGAAGALTRGIGGAVAAKKSFTPEQEAELEKLLRQRAAGNLGLSRIEKARLQAQTKADEAAALRDVQATTLQAAAAQGASGGGVSGRDVFLRELAGQTAVQGAQKASAERMGEAQAQARAEDRARLKELQAAQAGAKAGVVQALTGGVAGLADVGAAGLMQAQQQEFELELAKSKAPVATLEELSIQAGGQGGTNPYSRRLSSVRK